MANEANTSHTDGEVEAAATNESMKEPVAEDAQAGNVPGGETDASNGERAETDQDTDAEDDVESLRAALLEARVGLEAAEDRALRAAAEAENVRKRADRSIQNAHKYALERFVADLLPAVDSFERATEAAQTVAGEAAAAMAEGIELSLKLLLDAMHKQGIEVVDPIGAPFDPNLHEAMSMIDNADAEPGSVIQVFQKGYTVNGRLARAARVIIAREPAPAESESSAPTEEKPA